MSLQQLYDLFLQNIRLHRPSDRQPCCPVCLKPLRLTGGGSDDAVTEGHVYPQGSGLDGGVVVECKRCNQGLGATCDQAFVQRLRIDLFRKGRLSVGSARALFENPGVKAQIGDQPAKLTVTPKENRPHIQIAVDGPVAANAGGSVSIEVWGFDVAVGGVLHSAYLRMFYHFGYEYVFNANVEPIRRDLARAATDTMSRDALAQLFHRYRKVMFNQPITYNWQLPHVVCTPPGRRCFVSVVRTIPGTMRICTHAGFREGRPESIRETV